ncbi:spore germination protein [Paenibacillaceae bacterium]|nr:spore germination protein [Paenibacillaceae bacterium]
MPISTAKTTALAEVDEAKLFQWFDQCHDVHLKPYRFETPTGSCAVLMVHCEVVSDARILYDTVLPRVTTMFQETGSINEEQMNQMLPIKRFPDQLADQTAEQYLSAKIFEGHLILFLPAFRKLWTIDIAKLPQRNPEESNTEVSILGPKDGFTEELSMNLGLIRKRMRTNNLVCEFTEIGTQSRTKVALLYMKNVAEPSTIKAVQKRLEHVTLENIISIAQLEEATTISRITLFPLFTYSGRPDFVVQSLTKGRFVLLLDGNAIAAIAPVNLFMLLKSPEDAHFPFLAVAFGRMLRLIGFIVSVFLPGFYISLTNFHPEQIPIPLLATVSIARLGLPFSLFQEMVLILILMEILREAGIRLPTAFGQTLTVVGGLIIGDAAIRAGLISPTMLVITAITIVASSTLGNQALSGSLAVFRFVVFLVCSVTGMFGFVSCVIGLVIYLSTLHSFGTPFLSPAGPLNLRDLPHALLRLPLQLRKSAPDTAQTDKPKPEGATSDENKSKHTS